MGDPISIPVLVRMQSQVDRWEEAADQRAIFLSCYHVMTRNMLASLQGGLFRDPAWVEKLLELFADYYFRALDDYEAQDEGTPLVWRLAFGAARDPKIQAVQHLVLGVNAHINFDLVLALVDMLEQEWQSMPEAARQGRFQDHTAINQIIARSIDEVQDEILARFTPGMNLIDRVFGRLDELFVSNLIASWRDQVWQQATQCLECGSLDNRRALIQQVEAGCLRKGQMILLKWQAPDFEIAGE